MTKKTDNEYAYLVTLAAWLASFTAFFLVFIKLYAWLASDASALLASATDSLLDLFASIMSVVILRFALAPPDEKHKFGHGKAESLAGLVQSAFVMGSAILLIINGLERTINPVVIEETTIGIIVTLITLIFTFILVAVQKSVIKKTQSIAISADSLHYQSDLLLNLGVLIALILSEQGILRADGIFTGLVGIYLFWGAIKIVWLSIDNLMDKELPSEQTDQIRDIVLSQPKSLGLHDLRTRRAGKQIFIQFHLELADDMSLYQAHKVGDDIEKALEKTFPHSDIFIHHDPSSLVVKG